MHLGSKFFPQIGHTPLVELKSPNNKVKIFAKLEALNPTASIKDRIAKYIIEDGIKKGLINEHTHIVEGSSGNTAASVAMIASLLNLPCTLYVPDKASNEKINLIKSYGANVVVKPSEAKGDEEYGKAAKIAALQMKNSFFMDQYNNQLNADAHYHTTGCEIWNQTGGNLDYFVATASTGGSICGISRYLKEKNKNIKTVLADPVGSIYFSYFNDDSNYLKNARPYLVEGSGKQELVDVMDFSLIDDAMKFTDKQAFETALHLARHEGLLTGGSSGGNLFVTYQLARQLTHDARIVTLLPDSGLKYLSTLYNPDWLKKNLS